ncbi:lipoprotein [Cystobacter fuscus]|uniref:Lipoprotein n=1 Tax=Cystobacter fuscus TaxID=43 RepID=A0A250IUD6_9BACT|nr:lipoprotein [Cystobacter fuscus]
MGGRAWARCVRVGLLCVVMAGCGAPVGPESPSLSGEDPAASPVPSAPVSPPGGETPPTGGGQPQPPAPDAEPPPPTPTVCAPTGAGPYWLQEGEPLTVTLRCGTGHTAPGLRFTVSPLPPGATVDEVAGLLRWTPAKGQAAVWNLSVTERSTGETGALKLGVAVRLVSPRAVQTLDPVTYTEEYGLPVFHLSFEGELTAGGYRPVQVVYRGHRYTMEVKYRGATSSVFPKRNYTFKFSKDDLFSEPELAGGTFTGRQKLVLITSFNDNSYMRPRLAFDLWNRMSPEHIQIKTFSAILYVNGRFHGVFTVADHVDDDLMERHGLSKDGDLFKSEEADANFSRVTKSGVAKTELQAGLVKKEGKPKDGWVGAYDTVNALTAFMADADAETFVARRGEWLHPLDYEDWWIFNTAILGTDSSAKNAYHYFDPVSRAPWRFIPWDLDASFGQLWDTRRIDAGALPDFTGDNRIFALMLADPRVATPLRERYRSLLHGPLSKQRVLALIDGYARELSIPAARDEARWREQYLTFTRWADRTDFTTHAEEVAYLRQWVEERWELLERQLP